MREFYVVAGNPRSGTSYLCDLLQANGLGDPREHFKSSDFMNPFSRAIASGESTQAFSKRILADSNEQLFGTKMMWTWLDTMLSNSETVKRDGYELLESLFSGCKFIYITRTDRVGQAISLIRAADTNEWTAVKDNPSEGFKSWPAQINPNRIHQTIVMLSLFDLNWRRLFFENTIHPFEVSYEELTTNPGKILDEIGRFLVGESFAVRSTHTKLLVQRDVRSEEVKNRYIKGPIQPF